MQNKLISIIDRLKNKNIMVIGDMVADVYVEGRIARISREAPVLILEHAGENVVPGGAANVVNNVAAMGGKVRAVGVVGNDNAGRELVNCLHVKGVYTDGIIADNNRPTITKTRIMAGGHSTVRQQVVRIDREDKALLAAVTENALAAYINKYLPDMAAVVLSDYGGTTISPRVKQIVISECRVHNIPCMVDSRYNVLDYAGVTMVKQNEAEAAATLGLKELTAETLLMAGREILTRLTAQAVVISRGPDGMTLFEPDDKVTHIPVSNISKVYDVTGAGDTVVAAMVLAVAAGAEYSDAARLSNYAAGVVVRKPGTATASPGELRQAIGEHDENNNS